MLDEISIAGGGDERCPSLEAGLTTRLGERTELLFPPRLQEEAASDFEGVTTAATLFAEALPKEVPPLITVVEGFGVVGCSMWTEELRLVDRAPNLPPIAAVIGT